MGQGISEVLTFAIGVAISPVPIIAVILMLFSTRASPDKAAPGKGRALDLLQMEEGGLAAVDLRTLLVENPSLLRRQPVVYNGEPWMVGDTTDDSIQLVGVETSIDVDAVALIDQNLVDLRAVCRARRQGLTAGTCRDSSGNSQALCRS